VGKSDSTGTQHIKKKHVDDQTKMETMTFHAAGTAMTVAANRWQIMM
jgi:hypothetical protein